MRLGVWIQLGVMAFVGGSLLRIAAETGVALFTMFGMIAFVLLGLRALAEVHALQSEAGLRDLERVLREVAARWPVLRLPARRPGAVRYLVHAGRSWVAVGVDTSSEASFWSLVRPGLVARTRRLEAEAARLPVGDGAALGDGAGAVTPVLVLLRRRVRAREEALGANLGVPLVNAEGLADLLARLAGPAANAQAEERGAVPQGSSIESFEALARRLEARILRPRAERVEAHG